MQFGKEPTLRQKPLIISADSRYSIHINLTYEILVDKILPFRLEMEFVTILP